MASDQSITPFPDDIDRDAFGHWLSGFVDGEGCFYLGMNSPQSSRGMCPITQFLIMLRADDLAILQLIRSYFQCGNINLVNRPNDGSRRKPKYVFNTANFYHLATVIVPHFDRYPLRAKKARDFAIWREGILLCHQVKPGRGQGMHGGKRWSPEELARFREIHDRLRAVRVYQPALAV